VRSESLNLLRVKVAAQPPSHRADPQPTPISSSGEAKRAHVVGDPGGDEIRVVAHREVVAAAHG
jgi:hypothetical protein